MELTYREFWTVIHGLVLGTVFLLGFTGLLAELWALHAGEETGLGIMRRVRRLYVVSWVMATSAWLTVITGTWIVYPWYRVGLAGDRLEGCATAPHPGETCSSRDFLLSNVSGRTDLWHTFGMEWKEHIGWAAPILATAAAFMITYYGPRLAARPWLRAITLVMIVGAFGAAAISGAFGAFLNKVAPIV